MAFHCRRLRFYFGQPPCDLFQESAIAVVTLEQHDGGYYIPTVDVTLRADIPNADDATLQAAAATAKANCPLSSALNAKFSLDAALA